MCEVDARGVWFQGGFADEGACWGRGGAPGFHVDVENAAVGLRSMY